MKRVFADTVYWVARINPRDQWHAVYKGLTGLRRVTTDEVLDEVLTYFSGLGSAMRSRAAQIVRQILVHPDVEVVAQSRQSFLDGLALYEARPDKGYSLTDCITMATMRQKGLTEILTRDVHFLQEGFSILP
ncbi:MAG: type II toxin-antitoxin system VapC family toxin [Isosphaeraceae bacterium]|nr:type II toxin-antitoxin system VapC family toxin [Isosphaeraceae bacterium]